ncbi:hypothetical protein VD0002_g5723 [Verticillium dahliae]|uniref:Uncharacterized protein n=2 Tax=Verticillium dahliae TaxID=27337 RepID=G2X7N3_VERDV|nr:uncharacterized protein VDAG_06491 [Verticillium dahliae VdLs.17]KAF3347615.1 Putative phosphoinositide 3-phosphatase [Verticillium dahliae VDG2]KAH6694541.1 hypothetical protein EV126DRAFT_77420 [Verticillium dahliae]EGY15001.1 hypothetical protein VDAG_06491 [Verticillium dahliae VdLs.17]PNH32222.1 hypothetical protein BJF96_g4434 [Verticillium dahliae]PNH57115.1 hypothetical protein VD0003_g669 [Verticillium dahliae]
MPRPTRSRRAPARAAAAPAKPVDAPAPAPASEKSSDDIYSHSDREHERLRAVRSNVTASGKKALQKTSHDRDLAMQRLAGEDMSTSSANAVASSEDAQVELGRKEHATPAQQRRDLTGLELDSEMFNALDDSLGLDESEIPGSVTASGNRSTNTSSLFGMGHKRRGRTPSISLQGNDAPIRPPSRGVGATPVISSSFNIGAFKRRAREPSILGTAQKARAPRPSDDSSDVDDDQEGTGAQDEDDGEVFAPEAESTPLNRREVQQSIEEDLGQEPDVTSSVKSRKRKSIEAQNTSDRPEKSLRRDEPSESNAPEDIGGEAAESDDESDLSSLSSMASPVLPALARPVTPFDEEIMAPPMSSGSEDEPWPDIHNLAKRRRHHAPITPTRAGDTSDASCPPSLTHSPNYRDARQRKTQKQGKGQKASAQVTTADLAGLLPRRRRRKEDDAGSDSEVDNSGLGQDDDELSYLDARASRRRARTTPLKRSSTNRPASRSTRAVATTAGAPAARRRTYGRRSSDKENTDDEEEEGSFSPAPDDTFDATPEEGDVTGADELKNAVTKFKEVDKWELEFEELTQSSSPSGAR